jgi:hypothetical protein
MIFQRDAAAAAFSMNALVGVIAAMEPVEVHRVATGCAISNDL